MRITTPSSSQLSETWLISSAVAHLKRDFATEDAVALANENNAAMRRRHVTRLLVAMIDKRWFAVRHERAY